MKAEAVSGMTKSVDNPSGVVQGEFFTDGETFVFRLGGTPLSGTGANPQAAFEDLMRARSTAGGLTERLGELAREQAGETVRASVIRWSAAALIAFGVAGGAVAGGLALAPMAVAAIVDSSGERLSAWVEAMPPATQAKITRLLHGAESCAPAASPPPTVPPSRPRG